MFYGNKEDFVSYHEARGRVVPATWDDDVIESSLLVSSEWLDEIFYNQWTGQKTGGFSQVREWPRTGGYTNTNPVYVFLDNEIPDAVEKAVYEAAWREAEDRGSLMIDFTPNKYTSVTVEGAISVDYAQNMQASDAQIQITKVNALMAPLLTGPNGGKSSLSGGVERV